MSQLSTTENRVLTAQAREALQGRWGAAVGTTIIFFLIMVASELIPVAGWIASFLIMGPLSVGFSVFAIAIARKQEARVSQLFDGFQKFGVSLGAYFLTTLFIVLWALLLIIPGIIAALSYSMTYFIIAEDDAIGPLDALRKSKEMMQGNKWKVFLLGLRFIGWGILCLLTLGIGFLWLFPYAMVSYANFYDDIQANHDAAETDPAV